MKLSFWVAACAYAIAGCQVSDSGHRPSVSAISPDGRNEIRLMMHPLTYDVRRDGKAVVAQSVIGLKVDGKFLLPDANWRVCKRSVSGEVLTPVYKKAKVDLSGNETLVDFGDWAIRLAARNDGVAYRFETKMPGTIRVEEESANVTVPDGSARCWACHTKDFGCEEAFPIASEASRLPTDGRMVYLPFAFAANGTHVAVTEADVRDYPIWNLVRAGEAQTGVCLTSRFAGWPTSSFHAATGTNWSDIVELPSGGRWIRVREHANYLTETEGARTFPWRVFVLADAPVGFCESDIVYALASPCDDMSGFSWVRPGKVAWDWWNCFDNQGDTGCNTKTYERFIDFAAKHGIEYVILDEGWSESLDIWRFSRSVDVPHLIEYGAKRGVGIILWLAWAQACGEEERVAEHFSRLGAKGFKVDFIDRGDAEAERFLWRFAEVCARNRMLVDYHGVHHPTGLSRKYPNIVNYEGVCGLERMKWFVGYRPEDMMDNDVRSFYLRLTAGPMDYTPGAMRNLALDSGYGGDARNPGSLGTRCRQMAMLIAYEAPLQMLCDSPSNYENNKECFAFMAAVPTVWDETVGLAGSPDTGVAVARRKGDSWYVAMLTNAQGRRAALKTDFLSGGEWLVESFCDAGDASHEPEHYDHVTSRIVAGETLRFALAPGGGCVARLTRMK